MDRNRLVSVIMPTYNAGKFLADSISSILDQTYLDLELLITGGRFHGSGNSGYSAQDRGKG